MDTIDKHIKEALGNATLITIDYPDGGFLTARANHSAFIKYNTGDCIWFAFRDNEYRVCKIQTSDDEIIEC